MVVKGKRLTLKDHYEKLKAELKDMTPREKLNHLWEYYKWVGAVFLGLVFVICVVIASIQSLNTVTRISGVMINVDVSPDGYVLLQDGFFEHIGAQEGKEIVELRNMQFQNPYTTVDQTYALDVQETVIALISAGSLDYLLYDELALPFFMDPETVLDLRELYTQQELEDLGSAVIRLQMPETGELIPLAIDISDTVFFQTYMETDKPIYLSFSIITQRKEACLQMWQFLKGGNTQCLTTRLAGTVVDGPAEFTAAAKGFFEAQGYAAGDDRLELTKQSFLPTQEGGEEGAKAVREHVQSSLQSGVLDYVVATSEALDQLEGLGDLRHILTEDQLDALGEAVVYRQNVPVAVDLQRSGITKGAGFLAFSANTKRIQVCKDFYSYLCGK